MKLVVKLSGKVLEEADLRREIVRQIGELRSAGHSLLIVHGAGKQLTELSKQLGIPVVQHQGRRVTDEKTLEVAKMVFSAVNRDLTALLVSRGVPALGLTAFDAGLTKSRRRPPLPIQTSEGKTEEIDFGLVADIREVNRAEILGLVESYLPVICSLCADDSGQILNLNADTVATELAIAWGADRLISVSDVDGIYLHPEDPSSLIPRLSVTSARELLERGCFTAGMAPKVQTALKALEHGVAAFQVVSGIKPGGLLNAINLDTGTLLVA